ncbi:MAG: OmpA family protein [Xenococcus sp. MO_188.B8]|nr:OmpA family protein [Xenococcus sp. MO_188.B8]
MNNIVIKPLGKVLKQAGLISDLQIRKALEIQSKDNQVKFGTILVSQGILKQKTVDFFVEQLPKLLQQPKTEPLGYYLQEASLIDAQQIEILLEEQKQTQMLLGQLMIEKGWLKPKTLNYFLQNLGPSNNQLKLLSPSQQEIVSSLNLETKAASPYALLREVFSWTGGHPLLTREICQIVSDSNYYIPENLEAMIVDKLVQDNVIHHWKTQALGGYLKTIQYYLLNNTICLPRTLLNLYLEILEQGEISADKTQEQRELIKLGLVTEQENKLKVANRIYQSIFNPVWVKKQLSAQEKKSPTLPNKKKVSMATHIKNEPLTRIAAYAITLGLLVISPLVIFFNNSQKDNNTPKGSFALQEQFLAETTATDANATEDTNRHSNSTIKVLGNTFSGYATIRSTEFRYALKKSGITLEYGDEFVQAQLADDLNQGKADIILTTLDQFIQHKPQGKIVALVDRTVGADAIVLNTKEYPQLKSLIDLEQLVKQKQSQGQRLKMIFAGDTPSELLAMILDTKFENFDLADFEVIRVDDATTAWKQMQAPQSNIALAVLWEPLITEARTQGNTVLLSSADAPTVIVDIAVASDRILESNPQAVKEFVEKYYHQIDSSIQNRAVLTSQIAADGNLNDLEAAAVFKGIHFFTSVEAQDWMKSETLDKRIGALAGILALSGTIDEVPPDFKALYNADFVNSAATRTNKLIEMVSQDNPKLAMLLKGAKLPASTSNVKDSEAQVKQGADIGNVAFKGEVKFAFGSAMLTAEGKRTLDTLAIDIAEFNPTTIAIKVQGHTSKTGSANLNQKLSQDRANVVVSYLKQKQLSHKFLAEGLGFSQPLPGAPPSSPLNQRTVIRLVRLVSN